MDKALAERLQRISGDPVEFLSRLRIINEKGIDVAFDNPHSEQVEFLEDLSSEATLVVGYKPRQVGWSTLECAYNFGYTYNTNDAVRTLVIAHEDSATDSIFGKIRYFHDSLPKKLQRSVTRSNKKELIFEDTGAGFRCMTAGGRSQAKSWTYQRLHADEVAAWPNAEEIWASATSTIHDGPHKHISIISTANGPGGLFHKKVMEAIQAQRNGDKSIRFKFSKWSDHKQYSATPMRGWEPDQEEYSLGLLHGLTMGQLYWRHEKIHGVEGIGINQFRRNYPLTIEDGFMSFDGSWFDAEYLNTVLSSLKEVKGEIRIFEPPQRGLSYAIGVDPSWCNGGDWAVAQVLSSDGRQVATLSCKEGGEVRFSTKVAELAIYYNKARCLVEANTGGAGPVVIRELQNVGIPLWFQPPKTGSRTPKNPKLWNTHKGNNAEGYAHLRQMVNGDALTLNDYTTVQELIHIREVLGSVSGQDGVHDDHADALMLAEWNRRTLPEEKARPLIIRRSYEAARNPFAFTRR